MLAEGLPGDETPRSVFASGSVSAQRRLAPESPGSVRKGRLLTIPTRGTSREAQERGQPAGLERHVAVSVGDELPTAPKMKSQAPPFPGFRREDQEVDLAAGLARLQIRSSHFRCAAVVEDHQIERLGRVQRRRLFETKLQHVQPSAK
jgi:hypothetical protein